jgi:hypothetical protein
MKPNLVIIGCSGASGLRYTQQRDGSTCIDCPGCSASLIIRAGQRHIAALCHAPGCEFVLWIAHVKNTRLFIPFGDWAADSGEI